MPQLDSGEELKLDDFLRMSDVATEARRIQNEVDKQFNIDDLRSELKKKLRNAAKVSGEYLNDHQIETAIQTYFDDLYSFKVPRRNFSTKIAEIYVERTRLAKRFGIPPLVAASVGGLIWLIAIGTHNAGLRAEEKAVETAVETAYQKRQEIFAQNLTVSSSPLVNKLPKTEREKLQYKSDNSQRTLDSLNTFFLEYCSEGTAEDDVTRENYPEVKKNLINIEESLANVDKEIQESKSVLKTQEDLILTRRNLETLIGEVRSFNPREAFSKKAENIYSVGLGAIERRESNEAQQKENELSRVKNDIIQFAALNSQTETLYAAITAIAKEEEAQQKGKILYDEARELATAADVPSLSRTVSQLQNLSDILNTEYTIRVINRNGVKSGIDRYYTDSRGKRESGYYLIVEAVDSQGRELQMNIRNEEDGQIKKVTMWGERVPKEVYESIKEDKLDNGIINNNLVGRKKQGYLEEEMTMRGVTKQGQITQW